MWEQTTLIFVRPKIKIAVVPVTCWLKGRVGRYYFILSNYFISPPGIYL
jgi:hypothetical protein